MGRIILMVVIMVTAGLFAGESARAKAPTMIGNENAASDTPRNRGLAQLSETDFYMDPNTKRVFRLIYDDLNEIYNREDLFPLDLYVNTKTLDTFWLPQAVLVNHALLQDASGGFKVDPSKVKREGDGYKVKTRQGVIKVTDKGTEYKILNNDARPKENPPPAQPLQEGAANLQIVENDQKPKQ